MTALLPSPMDPMIVTVGENGEAGGAVLRSVAHLAPGIRHLAVSLQVVDFDGRWLLQRRSAAKAVFPGRWANTCCTHPGIGEAPADAARRRVVEETGLAVGDLLPAGSFEYRAVDERTGYVECELDHVYVAVVDTSNVAVDASEIDEVARLAYPEALRLVTSESGAPWAAEVLRLASRSLQEAPGPGRRPHAAL